MVTELRIFMRMGEISRKKIDSEFARRWSVVRRLYYEIKLFRAVRQNDDKKRCEDEKKKCELGDTSGY